MSNDDELLYEFVTESREHLSTIEDDILALGAHKDAPDPEQAHAFIEYLLDPKVIAETGLTPAAACDAIEAFLEKNAPGRDWLLCGHNIAFDVNFLKRLYRLAGREYPRRG